MPYRALYDHKLGLAKSQPLSPEAALKLAQDWLRDGEPGVRIIDDETDEVWTVEAFKAKVG